MTSEPDGPEASELTPRIGNVARRSLAAHGITTYEQLAAHTPREVLEIHGVGPKAVRILTEELDGLGLAFARG